MDEEWKMVARMLAEVQVELNECKMQIKKLKFENEKLRYENKRLHRENFWASVNSEERQ